MRSGPIYRVRHPLEPIMTMNKLMYQCRGRFTVSTADLSACVHVADKSAVGTINRPLQESISTFRDVQESISTFRDVQENSELRASNFRGI